MNGDDEHPPVPDRDELRDSLRSSCARRILTGSARSAGGCQVAWAERLATDRAALPFAARASGVGCAGKPDIAVALPFVVLFCRSLCAV